MTERYQYVKTILRCAGEFQTTTKLDDIRQLLKTFQGIADHYKMPLLQEQVEWIFKMNPGFGAKTNSK